MNLKPITAIVLEFLCATSVFSVSLWCVFARNSPTTKTQRTQRLHREEKLVKQITQKAERFYKTFIRENPGTDPLGSELNGHFEDLLLTIDGLANPLEAEVPQFHDVSLKSSSNLLVVLEDFRHSAQTLNASSPQAIDMRSRIEAVRNHSHLITESLERYSITRALQHDWKRVTSQLEELVRLYLPDSVGSIQNLPPVNTLSALFTVHPEARNLQYCGGVEVENLDIDPVKLLGVRKF